MSSLVRSSGLPALGNRWLLDGYSLAVAMLGAAGFVCYFRGKSWVLQLFPGHGANTDMGVTTGPESQPASTQVLPEGSEPILRIQQTTLGHLPSLWGSMEGACTYSEMLKLLCRLNAGTLVVMYDASRGNAKGAVLDITSLSNLLVVFETYGRKAVVDDKVSKRFEAIAMAFTSNPHRGRWGDKWAPWVVSKLAKTLAGLTKKKICAVEEKLSGLKNQPSDGAFAVLSLSGSVVAANCKINLGATFKLLRPDETTVGTKHHAGVAVVEWLKSKELEGVVLVRSDAGQITAIFEDRKDHKIKAYQISTPRRDLCSLM